MKFRIRKTINDAQIEIDNLNLEFVILEYKSNSQKSKFKHSCGEIFETRLSHLLDRKRCPKCHGKFRDKEMFQKKSNEVHNYEYEILDFTNGNSPVKIKHKKCSSIYTQVGNRHLRGDRCFNCYGNKKLTRECIIERSTSIWKGEYEILSDNVKYNEKSKIRHKVCGYKFYQIISSHLLGIGCSKCAGNSKHTINSVQEKSDIIHNFEYKILTNPEGSKSKIKILHLLCGKEFEQVLSDHLSGCGCIICNISKGEKNIENILTGLNINFTKQKTFEDCKFKNKLKFDFYIPEKNICIEFDGEQHFKPIRYFGGNKSFELQKIKDQIKNEYCNKNKIKLIRFRFDEDPIKIEFEINKLIIL